MSALATRTSVGVRGFRLRALSGMILVAACLAGATRANLPTAASETPFRPPAVPLVTSDPFLSIWSEADRLTDDTTRHWTHREHALVSLIRIDGRVFRLMGVTPAEAPAMPQSGLQVLPTRSIYDFDNRRVHVTLTFMTPVLPDDLEILTRPVTYITWQIRSVDGRPHSVSLYDSTSSQIAVNTPDEAVQWAREPAGDLTALRAGTSKQPVLMSSGDDTRIDWGFVYAAAPSLQCRAAVGPSAALVAAFCARGEFPATDDARMPRPVTDEQPVLAFSFDLGPVGRRPVARHVLVAYDEVYAIKYYGAKLRPYWRRKRDTAAALLADAERDYHGLRRRCELFDREVMSDLRRVGGVRYARLAALAYRQCLAGTGIAADANGQPLLFTKENTSNGDIATVDVIYPMEPIWLLFSPTLAKASLVPDLAYAASGRWRFPNAPHDLGTYPIVRGTDDGGEGMPVEESGNIILLCDGIARDEGNADFLTPWWHKITQWAQYLERYGLDPEEQLCTDDFMGHLAHNANLSVKAILALAAYGDLCRMRGDESSGARYAALAKADAAHWLKVADDGGHSRLAFDRPNTWSQKYNLVWDRILDLKVFPPSLARRESTFYKGAMQRYGVPLDSRTRLTKTDWSLWSATLAQGRGDFEALVAPIYDYLNGTTSREPLVDSYVTDDIHSSGMHARPVVGGLFVKMLADPEMRRKWSSRDRQTPGGWAPLPGRPRTVEVVPTGRSGPVHWRYTVAAPSSDWTKPEFDASGWQDGMAPFGSEGTPGIAVRTAWKSADIWMRREFVMPAGRHPYLQIVAYHDEDVTVYVNGVLAGAEAGFVTGYVPMEIGPEARAVLKPGTRIVLAVQCHQTVGGQGVDVGFADVFDRP